MMQERVKRAVTLMALLAVAASAAVYADEGLERSVKAGNSAFAEAEQGIQKSLGNAQKQLAENAKKRQDLKVSSIPGLPGHYYPGTIDNPPDVDCGPSRILVYVGNDQWACYTRGGDKALGASSIPGLPGHYYPGTIDKAPDVDCGPSRILVYVGNDHWACYTRGGDKALVSKTIQGLPGHYYPGAIDKAPDVDCGIGRQLTYWGLDQWTCTTRGGDKSLEALGAPNSADPYVPKKDRWGGLECLPGWQLVNRDYISPSQPGVIINPSCVRGGDKDGGHGK
ncbi:MAG: hypothetical protein HY077_12310 [Elusimicrobia bacterium]|nr:hypothetical protein [Elusimicrobiota bacterium]